MGERKVLNKYYPPDFDPAKIPRRKRPRNEQIKVRMMLPMSIRCNTCGNYIYKGTKFNSRKEDCEGETYLGIQIFRFYFKCSRCSAELTMKTDPQNSDYIMESGASRNFEPWRATDEAMDEAVKQKNTEEMGDAMKALENRTIESKQEMDILAALDEMKSMRARHAMVGVEDMMQALRRTAEVKEKELAEADEAVLRSVVFQNSQNFVRRLDEDVLEDEYMVDIDSNEDSKGKGSGLKSTDLGGRSTAQVVDTLVSHVPEHRAKGLLETGLGSQGVTKPHVPVFAVKAKKVRSSEKVVQPTQVVQEMAQAKNPMDRLLDYSSDNDDEESPGESTRSSNISKVRSSEKVVQPTQVVQEMARAKNPMDRLLDYSSDDDDEESPGESTRSSYFSKEEWEEWNMGLEEQLRGQVQKELESKASGCSDMATLLRRLGVAVEGGLYPSPQEVNAAYRKAILHFHPDRMSALARSDPRQVVQFEETCKLISRLKNTLSLVPSPMFNPLR